MNIHLSRLSLFTAFTALTLPAGCRTGEAPVSDVANAPTESRVAGSEAAPASSGSVVTGGGVRVSLEFPDDEIHAGDLNVIIRAEGVSANLYPRSVDVMSPTMPLHGVARVSLEELSPGTFTATASLPMAGRWALFVNLDEVGAESAEFQFDALPENESRKAATDGNGGHAP